MTLKYEESLNVETTPQNKLRLLADQLEGAYFSQLGKHVPKGTGTISISDTMVQVIITKIRYIAYQITELTSEQQTETVHGDSDNGGGDMRHDLEANPDMLLSTFLETSVSKDGINTAQAARDIKANPDITLRTFLNGKGVTAIIYEGSNGGGDGPSAHDLEANPGMLNELSPEVSKFIYAKVSKGGTLTDGDINSATEVDHGISPISDHAIGTDADRQPSGPKSAAAKGYGGTFVKVKKDSAPGN